jgi:hypothetical protein
MAEKMTRRTFMKSAAVAAAAVSLSGVLVGCGGGSAAADEVKLGAYTVKLYSANTHADVQGTGASSYKITAKADITFDKNAGGTFQELPCTGMFTGKIDTVSLNTTKPTGSLTMSNFAGLNWFMSKATVEVEMTIPTEEAYEKIAAGTPVEITVKLNNVEGKLYIVQKDQTFLVLNTDPTPAG